MGVFCLLSACQGEPETLCDAESLQWSLEDVAVSPAQDKDPAPGVQIDIVVQTSLAPGVVMTLSLGSDGPKPEAVVAADGKIVFENVTMPFGPVKLSVVGRNECREIRSSRNIFVFDEEGDARCQLSLGGASPPASGIETWSADADADIADGFQGRVIIATGRPGVMVKLLVLNVGTMLEQAFLETSDTGDDVEFVLPFDTGRHSMRAICEWDVIPVPRLSATHTVDVLSAAP